MSFVRRNTSQTNPFKDEALRKLRAGKITIPQAAKLTGAPISGVIGWMKLAKIEIPPEFAGPRRQPKAPEAARTEPVLCAATPAAAASTKRASDSRSATKKASRRSTRAAIENDEPQT